MRGHGLVHAMGSLLLLGGNHPPGLNISNITIGDSAAFLQDPIGTATQTPYEVEDGEVIIRKA